MENLVFVKLKENKVIEFLSFDFCRLFIDLLSL